MELKHSKITLIVKIRDLKTNDSAYLKDREVITNTEKEINNLENNLTKINYQDGTIEELLGQKDTLVKECRGIRAEMDRLTKFEFKYQDPIPPWDKKRVKGYASNIFRMKDQKHSRALSTVIGGRWSNVITDNDETGKLLLGRGKLQTRTTIIPMSKISSHSIDQRTVNLAQELVGKENAIPAFDLIEYDKEVGLAMRYLFGGYSVCIDLDCAKKVTYHDQIRTHSITLEGDSVQQGVPILDEAARYNELKKQYDDKVREFNEISRQIASLQQVAKQFKSVKDKLNNF